MWVFGRQRGAPCTYDCEECNGSDTCTCLEACTEESVNEDCPVCKGGEYDLCKGGGKDNEDSDDEDSDDEDSDNELKEGETVCRTITTWEWIDEDENLDPESGALVLFAEEIVTLSEWECESDCEDNG